VPSHHTVARCCANCKLGGGGWLTQPAYMCGAQAAPPWSSTFYRKVGKVTRPGSMVPHNYVLLSLLPTFPSQWFPLSFTHLGFQ
jgi:hypothetical protein